MCVKHFDWDLIIASRRNYVITGGTNRSHQQHSSNTGEEFKTGEMKFLKSVAGHTLYEHKTNHEVWKN
jgi:hypothetical protein